MQALLYDSFYINYVIIQQYSLYWLQCDGLSTGYLFANIILDVRNQDQM
jgi:hypothetical protein